MVVRDPSQNEKCSPRIVPCKQVQQNVGPNVNPASQMRPILYVKVLAYFCRVEVVFQVDAKDVDHCGNRLMAPLPWKGLPAGTSSRFVTDENASGLLQPTATPVQQPKEQRNLLYVEPCTLLHR